MKCALVFAVAMCLAQNPAHGHAIAKRSNNPVQDAANTAMATISTLATTVGGAIVEGNRLLHEYSDNSTDYASYFRIDVVAEITTAFATLDRAFAGAAATVNASNSSVLACFMAERNRTQSLAINLVQEVVKCGITKVRQFVDLGINLGQLGNTTLYLVPNTNAKIQNCTHEPNDLFKYGCIGWQMASATAKLAEVAIGVGTTVATGTALYGTVQADLILCAQAKLFTFRQRIIEIPLTIGICTGKSMMG